MSRRTRREAIPLEERDPNEPFCIQVRVGAALHIREKFGRGGETWLEMTDRALGLKPQPAAKGETGRPAANA